MSIRIGSRGAPVTAAQTRLNELGSHVQVDGRYGRETATAVRAFQRSHHLAVDGVVGRETARAMGLTDGFDAPAARAGRGSSPRSPGASTATPPADTTTARGSHPRSPATPPADTTTPPPAATIDSRHGALITPAEHRDLSPMEQTTLAANRMNARLDSYTQHGEPVPPEELVRAQTLSQLMAIPLPLAEDPTGELNDFAVARGGLADRLQAIGSH